MGLSYFGTRRPKATPKAQFKVENGLGRGNLRAPAGADDPDAELSELLEDAERPRADGDRGGGRLRHTDADVLGARRLTHLESLNSLIARLPAETSNEYGRIQSVIAQCVKAEMLAIIRGGSR